LFVDDIKGSASLAVADFTKASSNLVKNTVVGESISLLKLLTSKLSTLLDKL
jgi:hypothetical protein